MLLTYEEMSKQAREFYKRLQINVPEEYMRLAVRSLTMPQYAKEYKDKNNQDIGDHRALATVGDAVCGAFVMLKQYKDDLTSEDLHAKKEKLRNKNLKEIGEKKLGVLFASNNDLKSKNEDNEKAYATAFEAVIGFIALLDQYSKTNNTDRILKELLTT